MTNSCSSNARHILNNLPLQNILLNKEQTYANAKSNDQKRIYRT